MSGPNRVPIVPEIDVVSAWKQASEGKSWILDVREPDELVEISVPGAIHVPLGSLMVRAAGLPRDRDLLVICRSGVRSAFATQFLLSSGFESTKNVTGGVIAWSQARLPYISHGRDFNDAERAQDERRRSE